MLLIFVVKKELEKLFPAASTSSRKWLNQLGLLMQLKLHENEGENERKALKTVIHELLLNAQ